MEKVDYLPLGSVVLVRGEKRKFMIVGRGLLVNLKGMRRYFDYGGCLYPEGMIGDSMVYFNHADIETVFAKGYADKENDMILNNINSYLEANAVVYGSAEEYRAREGKK